MAIPIMLPWLAVPFSRVWGEPSLVKCGSDRYAQVIKKSNIGRLHPSSFPPELPRQVQPTAIKLVWRINTSIRMANQPDLI
ncbi:hypothetical protein [Brunnivagina elsteri]|uniref:Uncharacterized protein n=1 Tax=Brunnivagina elsteri CCALA 953 TaxID=987040 RepID=A0A2A2TMZ0_9CYAN|nr:hypothetical protein [Calothrix elsteri]PAX59777.1 hypothetical protein CK510_05135 [Calothrix elsteri CCALA 953]